MVGKPSICRFVAIEKRHIAAALLLCPEDGTGAVQLSVVLFLAANNGCTNGCTTADKHKDNQQSRVACVAGLRQGSCIAARFIVITGATAGLRRGSCIVAWFIVITSATASACIVITRKLCGYSLLLGDFLCCFGILVIFAASFAIPVFDIAFRSLGCRFCFNVLQVGMVICVEFAVAFAADRALCLILAGGRAAGVFTQRFATKVALVILIGIGALAQNLAANIAFVIFVTIRMVVHIGFLAAGALLPMGFIISFIRI